MVLENLNISLQKQAKKNKIATPHTHTHTRLDTTPQVLGTPLLICVLHYLRSVHQKLDQNVGAQQHC